MCLACCCWVDGLFLIRSHQWWLHYDLWWWTWLWTCLVFAFPAYLQTSALFCSQPRMLQNLPQLIIKLGLGENPSLPAEIPFTPTSTVKCELYASQKNPTEKSPLWTPRPYLNQPKSNKHKTFFKVFRFLQAYFHKVMRFMTGNFEKWEFNLKKLLETWMKKNVRT